MSWRARVAILNLSIEARGASHRQAIGTLRQVFRKLTGRPNGDREIVAGHIWLAYQRVLFLQRVSRTARGSRGTEAERLAAICARTRCSFEDAAWALSREDAPAPGHRLDAAIQKAREEGYLIPRASTEARAFSMLRKILRGAPGSGPQRRPVTRRVPSPALPARVALAVDSA